MKNKTAVSMVLMFAFIMLMPQSAYADDYANNVNNDAYTQHVIQIADESHNTPNNNANTDTDSQENENNGNDSNDSGNADGNNANNNEGKAGANDGSQGLSDAQIESVTVYDSAGVLSENTKNYIVNANKWLKSQPKTKELNPTIAVWTEPNLPSDIDIDEYKTEVFNKLGVGSSKTNTGVLILVFPDSHKYAVAYGSGFDYYAAESLSNDYISSDSNYNIINNMRAGDYDAGILGMVKATVNVVYDNGDAVRQEEEEQDERNRKASEFLKTASPIALFIAIIGTAIIIGIKYIRKIRIMAYLKTKRINGSVLSKLTVSELTKTFMNDGITDDKDRMDKIRKYWIINDGRDIIRDYVNSHASNRILSYYDDKKELADSMIDYITDNRDYYVNENPIDWNELMRAVVKHDSKVKDRINKAYEILDNVINNNDYIDLGNDFSDKYGLKDEVSKYATENDCSNSLNYNAIHKLVDAIASDARFDRDFQIWKRNNVNKVPKHFNYDKFRGYLHDNTDWRNRYSRNDYNTAFGLGFITGVYNDNGFAHNDDYNDDHNYDDNSRSSSGFDSSFSSGFDSSFSSSSSSSSYSNSDFSGGSSSGGGFSGGW